MDKREQFYLEKIKELNPEIDENSINFVKENNDIIIFNAVGANLFTLPEGISLFDKIWSINLSDNNIDELPSDITKLSNLTHLNITANRETLTLPNESFPTLERLIIRGFNTWTISNFPANLIKSPNLELIEVDHFEHPFLESRELDPQELIWFLRGLIQLQEENVSGLIELDYLQIIRLGNIIKAIESEIERPVENNTLLMEGTEIIGIDLSFSGIDSLPEFVSNFLSDTIEDIILSNNEFSNIPKELSSYNKLQNLDLSNNNIQIIKEIQLEKIRKLNLSTNAISSLDISTWHIPNIREINLSFNPISEEYINFIGKELFEKHKYLTKIVYGDDKVLSNSVLDTQSDREKISILQKQIGMNLENRALFNGDDLIKLNLSGVGLDSIPIEIFKLENLQMLNLSFNNISEISKQILSLKNLNILILHDNPITSVVNLNDLPLSRLDLTNCSLLGNWNRNISDPEELNKVFEELKKIQEVKDELLENFIMLLDEKYHVKYHKFFTEKILRNTTNDVFGEDASLDAVLNELVGIGVLHKVNTGGERVYYVRSPGPYSNQEQEIIIELAKFDTDLATGVILAVLWFFSPIQDSFEVKDILTYVTPYLNTQQEVQEILYELEIPGIVNILPNSQFEINMDEIREMSRIFFKIIFLLLRFPSASSDELKISYRQLDEIFDIVQRVKDYAALSEIDRGLKKISANNFYNQTIELLSDQNYEDAKLKILEALRANPLIHEYWDRLINIYRLTDGYNKIANFVIKKEISKFDDLELKMNYNL